VSQLTRTPAGPFRSEGEFGDISNEDSAGWEHAYMRRLLAPLVITVLLATACGTDSSSDPDVLESEAGAASESEQGAETEASSEPDEEQGSLIESGFGQSGQYVWVTAIVENTSDHGGQTVTVNFNALDDSGEVVGSVSQVNSFSIAGQVLAVGTQMDVGRRVKVASIEPTLLVEDDGTFEETDVDYGTVDASSIELEEYTDDQWVAKFKVENPDDEPLQSPSIGIACRGQNGKINGGGVDFPDLVPPSGEVVIEPYLITSGKPASCTAFIGPPVF
jgi:hypothetical protein